VAGELSPISLDLLPRSPSLPLPPPEDFADPSLAPDFAPAARYICVDWDVTLPDLPAAGLAAAGAFDPRLHYIVAGPVRPHPGDPVQMAQHELLFAGGARGRNWVISADFTGSGATGALVEAYLRGARVMEPTPLEMLEVPSLPHRVAASTSVSPTGVAGFALYWSEAVLGLWPAPWDELRISPELPANPMQWLARVTLQGEGLERLEILGEATKPARPGPLSVTRDPSGALLLSYPTERGRPYRLEYKTTLNAPAWELLDSFLGDGSVRQVTDPVRPGETRFYRLGGR
ncbi:MAG TPA: hypothetical protein VNO52_00615, partial [Methylomirabilota bacterium]|nr:hypothetical protein [Methylomirabilota bacterium]